MQIKSLIFILILTGIWATTDVAAQIPLDTDKAYRHEVSAGLGLFWWGEGFNALLRYKYKVNDRWGFVCGLDIGYNELTFGDEDHHWLRENNPNGGPINFITENYYPGELIDQPSYDFDGVGNTLISHQSINSRYFPFVGVSYEFLRFGKFRFELQAMFSISLYSGTSFAAATTDGIRQPHEEVGILGTVYAQEYWRAWQDYYIIKEIKASYALNSKTDLIIRYALYSYKELSPLDTDRRWFTGTMSTTLGVQTSF